MKITKRSDIPPTNYFLFPYKTEEDKEFVNKVKIVVDTLGKQEDEVLELNHLLKIWVELEATIKTFP